MTETAPAILEDARCRGCGYALRGLISRKCPECGSKFDPADRSTMSLGRNPGPLARRLMVKPARLTSISITLSLLLLIWGGSWLAFSDIADVLGSVLGLLVLVIGGRRLLLAVVLRLWYRRSTRDLHVLCCLIILIPVAALEATTGNLRFLGTGTHQRWLNRYAHHVYTEIPSLETPKGAVRVGLMRFQHVEVNGGGVIFFLSNGQSLRYTEWRAPDKIHYMSSLSSKADLPWPWSLWPWEPLQ